MVMECVAGKTLDALIPRQGMRLADAIDIAGRDTFDINVGAALGGQARRCSEVVTVNGRQECVDMHCVPFRNEVGQVAGIVVSINN